jgi:hypothetical protein
LASHTLLAWAIPTCHAHATRHSLQRTKHNHHLATPSSHRRVASTATRSLPVHQRTLFPLFCLLPSPPPVLPKEQQCVVGASSAHLCRAQIAQLTVRLQIGIVRLHHVTLPQLSLTRLQKQGTRVREPSSSAETPVKFHSNEHRLQTRNTPAESHRPGSPNPPCVSISCFLTCPHPRRVCRKPFEPSH